MKSACRGFTTMLALAGVLWMTPAQAPAQAEAAPTAQASVPDRLGLFIGIGQYGRMRGRNLRGPVNDARLMESLFRDRFGVQETRLLLDEQATAEGIAQALRELIDRTRQLRQMLPADRVITVIIFYAGHGSQVRDQSTAELGKDEADGLDSTWVPHDSSIDGDRDIRDDEIRQVHSALIALGAQVLLISDSCHSGTIDRSADFVRARGITRVDPAPGPQRSLFADLPDAPTDAPAKTPAKTSRSVDATRPQPGLIRLSAARDDEKAWEYRNADRQAVGRFTEGLALALSDLPDGASYEDLYRQVRAHMLQQAWSGAPQEPQFDGSIPKLAERFLEGGYPPWHARLTGPVEAGAPVVITMGSVHGVSEGAPVTFYATLAELERAEHHLVKGTIIAADPFSAQVQLNEPVPLPADARALVSLSRLDDLKIHLDETTPPALREALDEQAAQGLVKFADAGEGYDYAIYYDKSAASIRVFEPARLPDPEHAKAVDPVWHFDWQGDESGLQPFLSAVEHQSRLHRLVSLDDRANRLTVRLVPADEDAVFDPLRQELRAGQRFYLELTNHTTGPLYPSVLATVDGGQPTVVYPPRLATVDPIAPGQTYRLPASRAFVASLDHPDAAARGYERTHLKIIATGRRIDLHSLTTRSRSEPRPVDPDPVTQRLNDLFDGAWHGTRSAAPPPAEGWATATITFDVLAPGPRPRPPPVSHDTPRHDHPTTNAKCSPPLAAG